jgi:hypothetical protein
VIVEAFTPLSALAGGGALIGLAASALYIATGRIAGVSSIAGGLLRAGGADTSWRLLFLAGLVVGAGATGLVAGTPMLRIEASWPFAGRAAALSSHP